MLVKSFHLILIIKYTLIILITALFILIILLFNKHQEKNELEIPVTGTIQRRRGFRYGYEQDVFKDLAKQVPFLGEGGEPAFLDGDAKKIGDVLVKVIGVNEELSEHISYNRSLRDVRNILCSDEMYDLDSLPTMSLVIVFYDEPYSILMRTVYNALNTVPKKILKEIILVDDSSTLEAYLGKFKFYIESRLPKKIVKYKRLRKRSGLIKARLDGAKLATGDVLVFWDAHCEGLINWAEPLLQRIKESPTSVALPVIDTIDNYNFAYTSSNKLNINGFDWSGFFTYMDTPQRELDRIRKECPRKPSLCPIRSPVMAGGLFAISREYFWKIGSYDEGMFGWGSENLDLAFRVWMCGGTIEIIPCSHVGHIYRGIHSYSFPGNYTTIHATNDFNTLRMARVWMDEYINTLYVYRPQLLKHPYTGDIASRVELRKNLNCNNFKWYLENIYPEKFVITKGNKQYGQISSIDKNFCIDTLQQNAESQTYKLAVFNCLTDELESQLYAITNDDLLRNDDGCAIVEENDKVVQIIGINSCDNVSLANTWTFTENDQLQNMKTGLCIDLDGLEAKDFLRLTDCNNSRKSQKLKFVKLFVE